MNARHPLTLLATASLLLAAVSRPAAAQLPTIGEYTSGMERFDGFVPMVWDGESGRLLLEIGRLGEDFVYLQSLATGIGSNRLGLDRGQIGGVYIARFERVGPKVHFVLRNPSFRAVTNRTEALVRSVEESFPTSTLASWDVVAEDGDDALVDATSFLIDDVLGVAGALGGGGHRADPARSRIHLPRTRAFPENTEIEAAVTFASADPDSEVAGHTPDGRSMTLREHHSFVQLPDDGFRPRLFDPRIGLFAVGHWDYGKSFDQEYVTRYAMRHRLQKRNPDAAMSEPIEPIVYYLDQAVPEPYRSAFVAGGEWWNQVFEAAGFVDAFQVRDMPPDMDPMDARYHVIQWVHRTEAGSSIGPSFVDPRTGEIIKAAVRMDSHRSLADYNLYAGVVPATVGSLGDGGRSGAGFGSGSAGGFNAEPELFLGAGGGLDWMSALDPDVTAEDFAMARRRQHSAHEIGHTLGLAHNFIAASNGRASVMDYPAPLIELDGDDIRLANAYRPGPGAYDSLAIRWAYTELDPDEEAGALEAIIAEGMSAGLEFITNQDNVATSSHPDATTWINGSDAIDELERVMGVRRVLIDRFGEEAIDEGEAMWRLGERFVPVYLHHRFQIEAAIKTVGGMEFRYGVRGDPLPVTRIIDGARQRRALDVVLDALSPEELAVPEGVLELLAPRPFGHDEIRFDFSSRAGPAFDQLGIARTASWMFLSVLLNEERMARLAAFNQRDPALPSPEEVVDAVVTRSWSGSGDTPLERVVERQVVDVLIDLAANEAAAVEARAAAEWGLRRISALAGERTVGSASVVAHTQLALADVERFLDRRYEGGVRTNPLGPPPGTPIGSSRRSGGRR